MRVGLDKLGGSYPVASENSATGLRIVLYDQEMHHMSASLFHSFQERALTYIIRRCASEKRGLCYTRDMKR